MHTYIALILAATLFQNHIVAAAASYWIDQSCITKNANFAATVAESMNMASSAASKNQAGDADLEYIARYIFNMNSLSAAAQIQKNYKLRNILQDIGGMTKAPDLKSASVRIYCDNDTRWELDTDRPNTPEALQNAKQTLPNQWWVDKVNGFRKKGTPQCQRRTLFPNAYTSAITGNTIKSRTNQADDYGLTYDSTMVRPRNVVTLCDLSLLPQAGRFPFFTVAEVITFDKRNILGYLASKFASVISFILLHELTHCKPWETLDVNPAYGWSNILINPDPFNNADNYAFYGLFSLLLDNDYCLAQDDVGARAGTIVALTD
ncbi:hypothetical protein MMC21_007198 [Puttea exsequens]|nr:hypothetical protein [Puttea exsequens]